MDGELVDGLLWRHSTLCRGTEGRVDKGLLLELVGNHGCLVRTCNKQFVQTEEGSGRIVEATARGTKEMLGLELSFRGDMPRAVGF